MVYRLNPLDLKLEVDSPTYKLGDTISLTVTLEPRGDVDVREARVDLVCVERFVHAAAPASAGFASWSGVPVQVSSSSIHSTRERTESYVHSSEVFLRDTRLPAGVPSTHAIKLRIQPVPPRHTDEAKALIRDATSSWTFKWRLVAAVNVVRGRDPKRQRAITVNLT